MRVAGDAEGPKAGSDSWISSLDGSRWQWGVNPYGWPLAVLQALLAALIIGDPDRIER